MKISSRANVAVLPISAILLSLLGLVFIYSASSYSAQLQVGDAFHYVKTQAVALVLGVAVMAFCSFFDLNNLKRAAPILYVISILILSLVFVPKLGIEIYGAKRWLNLGFVTVQPSEYAKFGLVVYIAAFAERKGVQTFPRLLHCLMAGGAMCLLLLLEPNMSITVCVALTLFILLFASGAKSGHLGAVMLPVLALGIALLFSEPYRVRRLLAFVNPWESPLDEGYQLIQSYYALGSGGLFGVGLFNSRQKYLFLPFAESDFVLAVIGEEIGLVGVALVLLLYMILVVAGIKTAIGAKDRFSCYLAAGITSLIAVQTVINVAVVCGAVPPTGLPLPFMSAGGSSLVAYLAAVGLLINVAKKSRIKILDTQNDFNKNLKLNEIVVWKNTPTTK